MDVDFTTPKLEIFISTIIKYECQSVWFLQILTGMGMARMRFYMQKNVILVRWPWLNSKNCTWQFVFTFILHCRMACQSSNTNWRKFLKSWYISCDYLMHHMYFSYVMYSLLISCIGRENVTQPDRPHTCSWKDKVGFPFPHVLSEDKQQTLYLHYTTIHNINYHVSLSVSCVLYCHLGL